MKKRILALLGLTSIALVSSVITFSPKKSDEVRAEGSGTLVAEDIGEKPVFYPADYSTSITGEPEYSTQKTKTFDYMNFTNAPSYYRGDSVKVAVLDSGINYGHEDFGTIQTVSRSYETSNYVNYTYYDYGTYPSHINDAKGHGTNVASVIASQINSIGCAGIAPNVDLYIYKISDSNGAYLFDAINFALQDCIDNHVDVINMSFQAYVHDVSYNGSSMSGVASSSTALASKITACYNAGITLVAAAGNYNTSEPSYPASNTGVISVGSFSETDKNTKAGFSNTYGIDLVAPGYVQVADKGSSNAYKENHGTSFSAPIVTAAIALYKQQNPSATPSQIEAVLKASCDPISGNPTWAGSGALNIDRFLGLDEPLVTNYTVSFNANTGSGSMSSKTTTGSSYVTPSCIFTKSGYTFDGWALNSASGTKYNVGDTISGISDNITLYATWKANTGGVQMDPNYYKDITSDLSGTTLLSALRTLNLEKRTRTISYSDMGTSPSGYYRYTDYDPATVQYDEKGQPYGTKILSFYSGISTTSWNREHVWPNSRGGGDGGGSGAPYVDQDIYMPRPTITEENSNRGNSKYVEGVVSTTAGWDPVAAFDSTIGTYANIRGECARIIFYCMTVNSKLVLDDTATGGTLGVTMGKLSDLLKWNLNYPVNDREIRRQSGGQYLQGNRNAFVDDPGYACRIWGTYNTATRQICGLNRTLDSIAVSNQQTVYHTGDTFVKPTVKATYTDGTTLEVNNATFSGFDSSIAGTCTINVSYTENGVTKGTSYQVTVSGDPIVRVTSVSLDETSATVEVGNTVTLNATVSPDNATYKTVTWSSNNTSVATVSNGVVTGVASGSATITATADGKSATCNVTVTPDTNTIEIINTDLKSSYQTSNIGITVSGINFDANNCANFEQSIQFKSSSGYFLNSTPLDIESIELVTKSGKTFSGTLYWGSSKNPSGNSVSATNGHSYSNPGDFNYFKIKAGSSAGNLSKIIIHLKEKGPEVTGIAVDPTSMSLDLNGTTWGTITANVTAEEGANTTVSWSSSDTSIATVSASTGNQITVTAQKVTNTPITITATAGEKSATCTVSVSDSTPRVTGLSLDKTSMQLDLYGGTTGSLTPTVTKVGNPSYSITWSSSDSSKVEVDQNGSLTAKGKGSATITARISDSISATCTVSVIDSTPIVQDVEIDEETVPIDLDVYSKKTGTITLKIDADEGAVYEVHWTSSDEDVATVAPITRRSVAKAASIIEASAEITAVGSGTTTITATAGGKEASYNLTIADSTPHASGVTLNTTSTTLNIADTLQLNATVTPPDAINKNVTWSSNDDSVASVTTSGLVTANSAGIATITVTTVDGGHTATCNITVMTSSETAIAEAKTWAIRFISQTTTTSTCKASTDEKRLSGLKIVWPDLQSRYENLSKDAKTAFCTSSDTKIKEALQHYQFIISKFNKDSVELTDFVVDGKGNHPVSSSRSLMNTMFSFENTGFIVAILSIIGVASIGVFVVYKRRKTY